MATVQRSTEEPWVAPVAAFWASAAGSSVSCSPESCVPGWAHPASPCSHAAGHPCSWAANRFSKALYHHRAGAHGSWEREENRNSQAEKLNICVIATLLSHLHFWFCFRQHLHQSDKPAWPAINAEVVWSAPAVLFVALPLPTGPVQALDAGHSVSVYKSQELKHNEPEYDSLEEEWKRLESAREDASKRWVSIGTVLSDQKLINPLVVIPCCCNISATDKSSRKLPFNSAVICYLFSVCQRRFSKNLFLYFSLVVSVLYCC